MVEPKVIYLESDEEVTSVVDKLRKTEFKEVVLVVPKEAGLLQSVVNLKLIKKQAEQMGKKISLVTQDKVGRNLAEKVGIASSQRLGAKPAGGEEETPKNTSKEGPLEETDEVVFKPTEIILKEDNEGEEAEEEKKARGKKANLMPRLPKKKLLIIGGILLLFLLAFGYIFLPRAKATILVQAKEEAVEIDFTGEKERETDTDKMIIPAEVIEVTKESSKKYPASGKKNVGTKATGSVKILNPSAVLNLSWVAGTRLYPDGSPTIIFRTTTVVTITPAETSKTITVEADAPGDQYNGFENVVFKTVSASLTPYAATSIGAMSGGTSKEVSYVTQADINSGRENLSQDLYNEITADFNTKSADLKVIEESKKKEILSSSADPGLNSEASEFTVKVKVAIKALGFKMEEIDKLVEAEVEKRVANLERQVIDSGADRAEVKITSNDLEGGKFAGTIETTAYTSLKLDEEAIKIELTNMGKEEADQYLKGLEGVEEVEYQFWPSFYKKFPRLKSHVYFSTEVAETGRP